MKLTSLAVTATAAALFFITNIQAAEPTTAVYPNFAAMAPQSDAPPASSGLFVTSTTIGFSITGAPCYGGSTGCGPSGSIAIPYPQVVIAGGSSVDIVTQLQDTAFTGTPTIKIVAKQGTTSIYSSSVTFGGPLGPGYVAYGTFPFTLPTTKGAVTISLEVVNGTTVLAKGGAKFTIN